MKALIVTQENFTVRRYPHRKAAALLCLGVVCAVTEERDTLDRTIDDLLQKAIITGVTQYKDQTYRMVFGSSHTKWIEWCGDKGKRYKTKISDTDWDKRIVDIADTCVFGDSGVEYAPKEPVEEDLLSLVKSGRLTHENWDDT